MTMKWDIVESKQPLPKQVSNTKTQTTYIAIGSRDNKFKSVVIFQ